jgi:UPF0755 protein
MLKRIIKNICVFFSLAVFTFLISTLSLIMYFNAPNSYHKQDKKFIIENGLTLRQVVNKLYDEKIIQHPTTFLYISQLVKGYNPTVRYGEYFFEKNLSYYKIMHKMVKGYISFRKITIAEGLSSKSALEIINNAHGLIGDLPNNIPEGSLLPETYFYSYNDTKLATVKRMQAGMQKNIDILWEERDKSVPLKNKSEAITLASIVERETGSPSERGKVASVFVNRLRKKMKLQSDPTIIYSFTMGDKSLERPIRKSDISNKSPYNTYNIYGLPPTPICNPGIESIRAVLNPPQTDYLYFVATGRGGEHNFSSNIQDHNNYVSKYYQTLKNLQNNSEKQE